MATETLAKLDLESKEASKEGCPLPEIDQLRQLFVYDKHTGLLYRKKKEKNGGVSYKLTGSYSKRYHYVNVKGKQIVAHRVIWAMVYGFWPSYEIDHIDRDTKNNRIENLREVTKKQNAANRLNNRGVARVGELRKEIKKHLKESRLTVKNAPYGIYERTVWKKWRARAFIGEELVHIGYFSSLAEAVAAAEKATERGKRTWLCGSEKET